mmetsp:Transcript_40022/g.123245  ORF Transcript_40022/g.123245 Transcript_40022/m.123245 type:complete len:302 (+) Transcript_40022:202-1107(+)
MCHDGVGSADGEAVVSKCGRDRCLGTVDAARAARDADAVAGGAEGGLDCGGKVVADNNEGDAAGLEERAGKAGKPEPHPCSAVDACAQEGGFVGAAASAGVARAAAHEPGPLGHNIVVAARPRLAPLGLVAREGGVRREPAVEDGSKPPAQRGRVADAHVHPEAADGGEEMRRVAGERSRGSLEGPLAGAQRVGRPEPAVARLGVWAPRLGAVTRRLERLQRLGRVGRPRAVREPGGSIAHRRERDKAKVELGRSVQLPDRSGPAALLLEAVRDAGWRAGKLAAQQRLHAGPAKDDRQRRS